MKIKRNLSGIYYRYKGDNVCFEDLPEEEQDRILNSHDGEFAKRLARILADRLYELGESFDIIAE